MGDFNFGDIKWELLQTSNKDQEFSDMINDSFLVQHVDKPTRDDNILDLEFSLELGMVEDVMVSCPVSNSDHNLITWDIICSSENTEKTLKMFNYARGDYLKMNESLQKIKSEEIFAGKGTDEMYSIFSVAVVDHREKSIPVRKQAKRKYSAYMKNSTIKKLIKEIENGKNTILIQI